MKKFILASNNKHKVREIKEILDNYEILTLEDIGFDKDIIEDGKTFFENSLIKAKTVSQYARLNGYNYSVIADDTGLCCNGLDGKPGVYSARYAGNHDDKANRDKLIKELKNKDKSAYFKCVIVIYDINDNYNYFEGDTTGYIIDIEKGNTDFGYDCIFYSNDLNKTFGEASEDEKNSVSHRKRALEKLKEFLGD